MTCFSALREENVWKLFWQQKQKKNQAIYIVIKKNKLLGNNISSAETSDSWRNKDILLFIKHDICPKSMNKNEDQKINSLHIH